MSKFLKIMIVLLTIVAMAVPVIASDLTMAGQMRVRAAYLDNDADGTTSTDVDQRLRVGGKFTVSDNVSVSFRMDMMEGDWGSDAIAGSTGHSYGRLNEAVNSFDRAHIDLTFDSFSLRAGTQWIGIAKAVDFQDTAFKVSAGPVTAFYSLLDEYGDAPADSHLFGASVNVGPASIYAASQKASGDNYVEVYLFGASVNYDLDGINIKGEFDYFTGDANSTQDATGLQAYVDASFAASDALTVGGALYYAAGSDDDEVQISYLGNGFNGWDPLNHGTMQNYNLQAYTRPFNAFGTDQVDLAGPGVIAAQVYADFIASDDLSLKTSLVYAVPEDDDNATADSAIYLNLSAAYKLLKNTSILGQFQYVSFDEEAADAAEDFLSIGTALVVNF